MCVTYSHESTREIQRGTLFLLADTLNILFETLYNFLGQICDATNLYVIQNKQNAEYITFLGTVYILALV